MSKDKLRRWCHLGEKKRKTKVEMDGLCQPRHESHQGQKKMTGRERLAKSEHIPRVLWCTT